MLKTTLIMLSMLLTCGASNAQRDDPPRIPQPVSINDLPRYGDILGLSSEQRLNMETAFDQYVDDVAPLRREMIEAAVEHAMVRYRGDEFNGTVVGFVARMQAIDQMFFAAIEPMLIEPQLASMQRVRDLRERTMLARIQAFSIFIGDSIPDLRERLESLHPPPEILAALEPAMNDYERRLTIGIRECFQAAMQLCQTEKPDDVARAHLIEGVKALRALNRKALDAWAPSLPEDLRDEWRDEAIERAYANLPNDVHHAMLRLQAALTTDLSPDERERIESLLAGAVRLDAETRAAAMDLYDENAIRIAGPQGATDDVGYYPRISALRNESQKQASNLQQSLRELLGKERTAKINTPRYRPDRSIGGLASACGVAVLSSRMISPDQRVGIPMDRSDPLLPAPLDARTAAMIASAFEMSDQDRAEIEAMISASAASLKESLGPQMNTLMRAGMNISARDQPQGDPLELAKATEIVREQMRETIKAADDQTLESIRTDHHIAADDPRWARIRHWSDRRATTPDLELRNPLEPSRAGQLDLTAILLAAGLSADEWAAVDTIVSSYESQWEAGLRTFFDELRSLMIEDQAQQLGWRGRPYDPNVSREDASHQNYQALAKLNQQALEGLAAALPAESASRVRRSFEQSAYPLAFRDPGSAASLLKRAEALGDLSAEQRSRLGEIRSSFDVAYARIQQQIINACAAFAPDVPYIGIRWTEERSRRTERFTLEFDLLNDARAQANRRAVRGLRLTLTPTQLQMIIPDDMK